MLSEMMKAHERRRTNRIVPSKQKSLWHLIE